MATYRKLIPVLLAVAACVGPLPENPDDGSAQGGGVGRGGTAGTTTTVGGSGGSSGGSGVTGGKAGSPGAGGGNSGGAPTVGGPGGAPPVGGSAAFPGDMTLAISPFEAARRLSRFLWGPNVPMVNPADVASVEQIGRTARVMATAGQATEQLAKFYRGWLQLQRLDTLSLSDAEFSPMVRGEMKREAEAFGIRTTLSKGRFVDLLANNNLDILPPLAPIYGTAPGLQMIPTRAGLLTMPGILAMGTKVTRNSPTRRGQFLRDRFLCQEIPPQPPGVPDALPPADQWQGRTLRQQLEFEFTDPSCASCHRMLERAGFAYEGFDLMGRVRTTDNGSPVDVSAALDEQPVNGPLAMAMVLAGRAEARRCFVQKWFEFATTEARGQPSPDSQRSVDRADAFAQAGGHVILDVIAGVAMSPDFLAP